MSKQALVRLMTVHPFDPWGSKIGGIESVIRSILQNAPDDFRMSVVGVTESPSDPIGQWKSREFEGTTVDFLPLMQDASPNKRSRIPLSFRFACALRKKRLKKKNAVAFYHRMEPLLVGKVSAQSQILCVHGNPSEMTGKHSEVKWRYIPWLYRLMEATALKKCNHLFCVSRDGINYFENHYQLSPTFLPTWYREDLFYPEDSSVIQQKRHDLLNELNITNQDSSLILFAGRWEKQKNPLLAIQTFHQVVQKHPKAQLILIGSGDLELAMRSLVHKLEIDQRVHFLGTLNPNKMASVMRCCDLFLMTSAFEGMPVIVLEALASGLPVVSTNVGEVSSLVADGVNGSLVSSPEPEHIANAVCELLIHRQALSPKVVSESVSAYTQSKRLALLYQTIRDIVT